MPQCRSCGKETKSLNFRFCPHCGKTYEQVFTLTPRYAKDKLTHYAFDLESSKVLHNAFNGKQLEFSISTSATRVDIKVLKTVTFEWTLQRTFQHSANGRT